MFNLSIDGNPVRNGTEEIIGLSTDVKPVGAPDGSTFLELDTGNAFMSLNDRWYSL